MPTVNHTVGILCMLVLIIFSYASRNRSTILCLSVVW